MVDDEENGCAVAANRERGGPAEDAAGGPAPLRRPGAGWLASGRALVPALLACAVASSALAQPFDFFFSDPRGRARATRRPVPRDARRPPAAQLRPDGAAAPDVPLPVPRPQLAVDPPAAPPAAAAAAPAPPPVPPVAPPAAPTARPAAAPASVAPSGATTAEAPRVPDADPGCLQRLAAAKVEAAPIVLGPQPDARCTVADPVKLDRLLLPDGSGVLFPDRPTISCTTAATFAAYVRELLAPLARGSFGSGGNGHAEGKAGDGSGLVAVWTGPGLECRSRDHIFGAKLSAHGQGLAVDIAQIKLADGRVIPVGAPANAAEAAFETAARAGACGYFHTVLGPGSDSYHRTHWHFDLEVRGRGGDAKYCK